MTDIAGRYPLSTAEGTPIPLDAVRPKSFISLAFTTAGATSAKSIPANTNLLYVRADQECHIQFATSNASASAIVDGTLKDNAIFIPKKNLIVVSPPIGMTSYSIRGISMNGTAIVQFIESWAGLSLNSQITRR